MKNYTIYCTEEQTKKAFRLGAPIITLPNYMEYAGFPFVRTTNGNEYPCVIPTAEQMIGWLEDSKSIQISIRFRGESWYFFIMSNYKILAVGEDMNSRKEATLSAIEKALEFIKED